MPSSVRFAVYASARGDCFFREIGHLLACGLRALGHGVVEADERRGFVHRAEWHLVVAPQQFFYLGDGASLRRGPWPAGVVLYNAEQRASSWFPVTLRLLPRAHAVWDADAASTRLWAREGARASHVPLGWVDGCSLFEPTPRAWPERALDLVFAGSGVPRRKAFFGEHARRLSGYRSVIRLVDDARYLRAARLNGLARRARIVLNIHRQETPYFEWHRIGVHGLGQGALVLSEPVGADSPLEEGKDFVASPLARMPEAIDYFLSTAAGRREAARIAARGARTYRASLGLAGVLPAAVARLGPPERAERRRPRLRVEAAAALLRAPNIT